jgi:hypothetical protein
MTSDKEVVNLSSKVLTEDEKSILSKGLKFCPSPHTTDPGEVRDDLDKLHKRLRQIAFYEDIEGNEALNKSQPVTQTPVGNTDPDNIHSEKPFKHRSLNYQPKGGGLLDLQIWRQ